MPRIIAGSASGIRLDTPSGRLTRPTSDRVKEALFSILSREIPQARVLDLYAGSGQLGIEAVSRGAQSAVLVDRHRASQAVIRKNIEKSGLSGIRLIPADVARALRLLREESQRFDLVFLDPPYRQATTSLEQCAGLLHDGLLTPDALIVLEHATQDEAPSFVTDMKLVRNCKYGGSMLSFYKVKR